jgi:aryl-alcohol dehydrogenase-like predicted oxidoreductase
MAAAERAWYAEQQTPLFTWSSLAGGFFSGRFHRDNLVAFESYLDKLAVETYCTEENFLRLDRAQKLAEEKGMTIPQIATAYVTSYPLNIFALVGCRTGDEFRDNVAAADLQLTDAEMAWLELRQDER